MARRIFAYGTLLFPQVRAALLGRPTDAEPAWLAGHARFRVRGALHPGAVPLPGARLDGVLTEPLTDRELALLDRFEGDLYTRHTVRVRCGSSVRRAELYRVRPERRGCLSPESWDPRGFARGPLREYAARCAELRHALR